MKAIIQNYKILNLYTALNTLTNQKLPVSVGWNLAKNTKIIKGILEDFLKAEQALVSEYALKKDNEILYKDNGQPEIQPKYQEVFIKEHNELLNCESQINIIPIKLSDILYTYIDGKKTEREIEPSLLLSLGIMIKDDLEE